LLIQHLKSLLQTAFSAILPTGNMQCSKKNVWMIKIKINCVIIIIVYTFSIYSDRKFFGVIISRGKGKYMCHVFQEYEVSVT